MTPQNFSRVFGEEAETVDMNQLPQSKGKAKVDEDDYGIATYDDHAPIASM